MSRPGDRGRLRHLATAGLIATLVVGCGPSGEPRRAESVSLSLAPCDDEADCALAYEYDGRTYTMRGGGLSEEEVAAVETDRLRVEQPDGIDALVVTDDPDVIYLMTPEGWVEARASGD